MPPASVLPAQIRSGAISAWVCAHSVPVRPPPVITSSAMKSTLVPARHFKKVPQLGRRVHAHAAGALHQRFDDDCGYLAAPPAQDLVQSVGRKRHVLGTEQQRLEAAEEDGVAADRHRPEGVAVVAILEADETRPLRFAAMAPELVRHLQRDLDRRAAVVGIEDAARRARALFQQQLRQLDGGRMRDAGEEDMIALPAPPRPAPPSAADSDGHAVSSTTTKCRR